MASKEKIKKYLSLKALFESGSVKKMRDIEKLFPTMVAKDLQMNHSRYISKLYKPETFSFNQVFKLASLLNIDPHIISDIIMSELSNNQKSKKK